MPPRTQVHHDPLLDADGHLYVFAYGSLIWRPGFPHQRGHPALLRGYHRRFCLWSRHYRGTPEAPGLVLGLDRGGACRGLAFAVAGGDAAAVIAYLDARENLGGEEVYARRMQPIRLLDSGRMVRAMTYVVNRAAPQYCRPTLEEAVATIGRSAGVAGSNHDYLQNTRQHLHAMGVSDPLLERIKARLEARIKP
jgi:cation transport protein ChaC